MRYRPDIDGLRAIAVLPVIVYHVSKAPMPGGYLGVDIFFVISGYLISRLMHEEMIAGRFSFARFWERRIRRLAPAAMLMMATVIAFSLFFMTPGDATTVAFSALWASLFLANVYFSGGDSYFNARVDENPLMHTWSLSVEEQFYFAFPILAFVLFRMMGARAIATMAAMVVFMFFFGLHLFAVDQYAAYFSVIARGWELGVGAMIGAMAAHGAFRALEKKTGDDADSLRWICAGLCAAGMTAILFSLFLLDYTAPAQGWPMMLPVLGAAAVIIGGMRENPASRMLTMKPLVFVGLASYGAYLWHQPFILAWKSLEAPGGKEIMLAAIVALSVLAGWASAKFVEKPVRSMGRRHDSGSAPVFCAFALGVAAMAAAAGFVVAQGGFPQRLGPEARKVMDNYAKKRVDAWDCMRKVKEEARERGWCIFHAGSVSWRETSAGDVDEKAVIVLGDSHAMALAEGLAMLEDRPPLLVMSAAGCHPTREFARKDRPERCARHVRAAFEDALSSPARTVIVHARWTSMHPPQVAVMDGEGRIAWRSALVMPPKGANERAIARSFAEIPIALARAGKRVIVVGAVPGMEMNAPKWALRRAMMHGDEREFVSADASDHARKTRILSEEMTRLLSREGVHFVDPAAALCDPVSCLAEDGERVFWRDDDHLSDVGALRMALHSGLADMLRDHDRRLDRN